MYDIFIFLGFSQTCLLHWQFYCTEVNKPLKHSIYTHTKMTIAWYYTCQKTQCLVVTVDM